MKFIVTLILLFLSKEVLAQSDFPEFLQGTWKMENKEVYEHWDKLNDSTLKGFSYRMKEGKMIVSEYLDISWINHEVYYTATVLHQNQGKGVGFRLTSSTDSTATFENPAHDFPRMIVYQKTSVTGIFVRVSDGKKKGFSYRMTKLNP